MTKKENDDKLPTRPNWELIDSWNGNDSRFWHRNGGEPYSNIYWMDKHREPNGNIPVCQIKREEDYFNLPKGTYKIFWDCVVFFKDTACESPRNSYPILQIVVNGSGGNITHHDEDEIVICASRDGLRYDFGTQTIFNLTQDDRGVNFSITSFADWHSGRDGSTNVIETIVSNMELYKKV